LLFCASLLLGAGGCGTFFRIIVVSDKFNGLSLIKQHRCVAQPLQLRSSSILAAARVVQDVLAAEIKTMHGVTLVTKTPQQFEQESSRS
jgi:stress-induced morphogen